PIAFKGANADLAAGARAAGLVATPDLVARKSSAPHEPLAPGIERGVAPEDAVMPPASLPALIIDKPLRSGQQVYARGRDLVMLAMVNAGAEVIADGHIHVYAPLRGKAIAGARGNVEARIFALSLEAELISIAGIYRTSEKALPAEVRRQPTQVRLVAGPEGDRLVMEPLQS
ncbi:MAG: septum site-determining protein MinC, partial [Burkholderiaceae bacterium]